MSSLKLILGLLLLILPFLSVAQPNIPETEFIKVDQFGYLTSGMKVAVISNPQLGFNSGLSYNPGASYQVREWVSDSIVFSDVPTSWNGGNTHDQSGDQGWWFDFSNVTTPGNYYVFDVNNNFRSSQFVIDDGVYNNILKAAGRMFYYNRCNIEKVPPYAEGNWTDATSFLNNLQDANSRYVFAKQDASTEKDLSGGWFDAGDFNKYVTFVDRVMHDLLSAYEENPDVFTDDWDIPESGNGIPDIIDELKWELDWLLKMNNTDGTTHIKMGSQNYSDNIQTPPSLNTDPRYYGPICTSASISVAGVFAHAAKVFGNFPSMNTYTQELETSAVNSWNYVLPLILNNQLETSCDNGEIISGDADWDTATQLDQALKAAIYLFDLTGNTTYNQYVSLNVGNTEQISSFYWAPYKMQLNDALLLYTTLNGADPVIVSTINNSILTDVSNNNTNFYGFDNSDLYRSYIPDWSYHWGSNLPKAGMGTMNKMLIRHNVDPANNTSYNTKANETVHYFHGVNPMGITYLTNMYSYGAERSANEMYHQWFSDGSVWDNALTSAYGPAPGYITGGANKDFSVTTISPPSGQPAQKSYLDFNNGFPDYSWEITEPSISYQSSYIRLLSSVMTPACPAAGTFCNDNNPATDNDIEDGNCNCAGEACIDLAVYAFLEGSYDPAGDSMSTVLGKLHQLLPGMSSNQASGQPYSIAPWNYLGIEGQGWVSSDYPQDAVDWVLVSLRTDITKASEVFRVAGILLKDGSIQWTEDCLLFDLTEQNYYIVLEHRNHMTVMSPQPIGLLNNSLTYDFRNANSYITSGFGQTQLATGIYGLYTGDVDQSSNPTGYDINASDRTFFEIDNGIFEEYLPSDFNLDGDVNGVDKVFWFRNNGIYGNVPR